jgi:hypothetical protein
MVVIDLVGVTAGWDTVDAGGGIVDVGVEPIQDAKSKIRAMPHRMTAATPAMPRYRFHSLMSSSTVPPEPNPGWETPSGRIPSSALLYHVLE